MAPINISKKKQESPLRPSCPILKALKPPKKLF
jgi:hypothetical protein